MRVLLAVDMVQFNRNVPYLFQSLASKEIGRVVIAAEHSLLAESNHRRELLEVTNHQQLHTAKGARALPETAQNGIHGIQQVTAHHTDFVDYKKVQRSDNPALLAAKLESDFRFHARQKWGKGQLEKGVDGNAVSIERRHSCGGHNNHLLG